MVVKQLSKPEKENNNHKKGFASMTPEARKAIASKGGKRGHELGVSHQFTSEEAIEAGRKGGMAGIGKNKK